MSVVLPVYNSEKYLNESIESVLNQTFKDFECIIINDGSTDNSEKIILSYLEKDNRIRYIKNKKNLGISATLNKGISLAKGEYIARMDSDDISLPERFEVQIKFMDTNKNVCLCGTKAIHFDGGSINDIPFVHESHKDIATAMITNCAILHGTVFLRKEEFKKHGFQYNKKYIYGEDHKLWSEIIDKVTFHNIQQILYKHRIHPNQSATKPYIKDFIILINEEILEKYLNRPLANNEKILYQEFLYLKPFYDYNRIKEMKKWIKYIAHFKSPVIKINTSLFKKKLFDRLTYLPTHIFRQKIGKQGKIKISDVLEILLNKNIDLKAKYTFIVFFVKENIRYHILEKNYLFFPKKKKK